MSIYNTYLAYRSNDSWTSERGASKFMHSILTTSSIGAGDKGGVLNGFNVSATDTPTMSVKISSGVDNQDTESHCIIDFNNYCYFGWLSEDYVLQITGSSQTSSRISYVVAYVDRSVTFTKTDNIIESPDVLKIIEVPGSDADSPVPPTSSQIQAVVGTNNPYIILAQISVPISTSTITNSLITDLRQFSKIDSNKLELDIASSFVAGFKQADSNETETRLVVTEPNDATPTAIEGVQLIWLKKKA